MCPRNVASPCRGGISLKLGLQLLDDLFVLALGSARVLAHFGFCLLCAFSVRFLYGVAESGHVQVAAGGPVVVGDVSDPSRDEHQRAPTIGESAHDAGSTSDLPVQSFDHVVRSDAPAMLDRVILEQVRGGLVDALAQALGGLPEFPLLHLGGDLLGLGQRRFA